MSHIVSYSRKRYAALTGETGPVIGNSEQAVKATAENRAIHRRLGWCDVLIPRYHVLTWPLQSRHRSGINRVGSGHSKKLSYLYLAHHCFAWPDLMEGE